MSEEEVQCMECSSNIRITKDKDAISYLTPLSRDEKSLEINDIIETQNFEDIHSGVCINCLHECLSQMKTKLDEEEKKHEDCLQALKDLLLDVSNKKEINKIIDNLLNERKMKELKENYDKLYIKRKELEKQIKKDKDELRKLKDEEQKIYIELNDIKRKKEDKKVYKEKLNMKKKYLQNLYEEIIKEEG